MVIITVKGRNNYLRFTIYNWLLEIKDVLENDLSEEIIVEIVDSDNDDPELYVNGFLIGIGVPGEEGYLIEIIKKAILLIRNSGTNDHCNFNHK